MQHTGFPHPPSFRPVICLVIQTREKIKKSPQHPTFFFQSKTTSPPLYRKPPTIVIPAKAGIHKVELRIKMIESRKEKLLILIS